VTKNPLVEPSLQQAGFPQLCGTCLTGREFESTDTDKSGIFDLPGVHTRDFLIVPLLLIMSGNIPSAATLRASAVLS
jgi:hypothetical protein